MTKHKVFISYHHANDQWYKNELLRLNLWHDIFIDASVDTGGISDYLPDDRIREIIRDDYLKDSTITILLVGIETQKRKHIDWEIYSSMYDGTVNKKSGILVVNLPSIGCNYYNVSHSDEKTRIYPENENWVLIENRTEYERRYPYMPVRIIDNLLKTGAKVSVTNWDKITNDIEGLRFLINKTFDDRVYCDYDLSRQMRRVNS